MGEISEALRRARRREAGEPEAPAKPADVPAPPAARAPAPPPPVQAPVEAAASPAAPELVPERRRERAATRPLVSLSLERSGAWFPRAVVADAQGAVAESFREIALRLRRELEQRHAHTLAVVSALRSEGKTTIACNLALAFASLAQGRAVALVDLDLRKPSVARALGLSGAVGIEAVLRGEQGLREACVGVEKPALDAYLARASQPDAHELLARPELEVLLRELSRRYEVTVIDTPPVLLVPDATMIVERVDAAVAVARSGRTPTRGFAHMQQILPPGRVVGSILNEGSLPTRSRNYGYYAEDADADTAGASVDGAR
jgi:Mrp family chromosome partitioning ATPase